MVECRRLALILVVLNPTRVPLPSSKADTRTASLPTRSSGHGSYRVSQACDERPYP
jgi:hypothetical protein